MRFAARRGTHLRCGSQSRGPASSFEADRELGRVFAVGRRSPARFSAVVEIVSSGPGRRASFFAASLRQSAWFLLESHDAGDNDHDQTRQHQGARGPQPVRQHEPVVRQTHLDQLHRREINYSFPTRRAIYWVKDVWSDYTTINKRFYKSGTRPDHAVRGRTRRQHQFGPI